MSEQRLAAIRTRLVDALAPDHLDIRDESHLHAGHPGARDGRGHYRIQIVSQKFAGHRALQRHQMIYAALAELMQSDIHALSIRALTPEEAESD